MKLQRDLAVLDLETTGTWIEKDRIIEIAIIKCFVDGRQETFHKVVNPEMPIPAFVSQLIGINDEDVKNVPKFKEIARSVVDFIGDADFAGFNVERFDLPLLKRELQDAGLEVNWLTKKVYDAQKVFHLNEKRDLTAAYQFYCRKDLEKAHSALADTQAALDVLAAQVDKYGKGKDSLSVLEEFNYDYNEEFYDAERKFRWWNGKLYMMFGKHAKKYSLEEVARIDRGYLEWILSADFSEDVKELVENALSGRFPVYSKAEHKK